MFRSITDELVKTLCSDKPTLGLGHTVVGASCLHEAKFVKLGTFVIKRFPSYVWQNTTYEYLCPLKVKFDESSGTEELTMLEDSSKKVELNQSKSANVSTLQFMGVNASAQDDCKIRCHLGKVTVWEMNENSIQDYRVPKDVVREFQKTSGKKALAVVVKLYAAQKPATIHFQKQEKEGGGVSAKKLNNNLSGGEELENSDKSFTMVHGQVLAYCIQEVYFDPIKRTFRLPSSHTDSTDDEAAPEDDKKTATTNQNAEN